MRTISQATEEVIRRSPFLSEIVAEGLGNNAEIARRVKPDVEKQLLEEVSDAAIAMALHRLSKSVRQPHFGASMSARMRDITVRSNLVQFVCPNSSGATEALETISAHARKMKDSFFNYSRGVHETLLIVSDDLEREVTELLGSHQGLRHTGGLSAITMRMPEESLAVPGVYYPILKAIALEGISLVEVMSVRTEFSVIFHDADIDRAFSAIKRITS
jgi:hypothetical protein